MRSLAKRLLILLAAGQASLTSAQTIPKNTQLNRDETAFLQNEEQLWISRTDSLHVVADWRDWRLGYRRVGFSVSTNAGVTWGIDSLLVGLHSHQSDPCVTGDRLGTFYMNVLDYVPGAESQVSVWRSTDNGTSWTGPVPTSPVGPYFEDKQFTAVDRTGGLFDGYYYMSWTRFPNTSPAVIMFVRSTDGAQSFDVPLTAGPAIVSSCGTFSQGQSSIPVVNSDGSVHVFWSGYDVDSSCSVPLSQSYAIRHVMSSDGGASFTDDAAVFPSNAYFERIDGGVDVYGFPMADADISGGAWDGTIYIAHTQYVSGNSGETDIQLRKSTDNGGTWTEPVVVNDDPPGRNTDQFHPWLAVNQDGVVVMVFYDQRTDPVNHYLFDCFFTASFDGAETFIANARISEVSMNPAFLAAAASSSTPVWNPAWKDSDPIAAPDIMAGRIAEYIAVHAYRDHVVAVWTDTRNGNQDVYSAQFEIPFVGPRLYAPDDGLVTTSGTPTFRWATCWHLEQDSYRLEISADSTFMAPEYVVESITDNEFTPPQALPTGEYFWRVKAFRTRGDSTEYSDVYRLSPSCLPGGAPIATTPVAGDTVDALPVDLRWMAVPDAWQYRVQLALTPDFEAPLVDSAVADTGLSVSDLPDSSNYHWRVRSTNECDAGEWAQAVFRLAICPIRLTGDVNVDGAVTSSDIIHLVNYAFKSGPPPEPVQEAGDVNCDRDVSSADIIYLVNFTFKSGPGPCDACVLL